MRPSREELIAREKRWALPVALATLGAIALLIASAIVAGPVKGDGDAEVLRAAHEHRSALVLSSILQTVAFVLLVLPVAYLFRATEAREMQVQKRLIGLIIAAPLFLAAASAFSAVATSEAASDFTAGKATADISLKEAKDDCRSERRDDQKAFRDDYGGAGEPEGGVPRCAEKAVSNDAATNAIAKPLARNLAIGLGLAGRLGLGFTFLYTCLWGMRVGLLGRFWGSLGMALGVAAVLLLIQFTLIWFLYFALLVAGWLPGGRPPAWAAGRAVPWPTPGEKVSAELEGDDDLSEDGIEEGPSGSDPKSPGSGEPKRKRKQRD
jgi:hypothetical protein